MGKDEMRRREFIERTFRCAAYAALWLGTPGGFPRTPIRKEDEDVTAKDGLLQAIESSDMAAVEAQAAKSLAGGDKAWKTHLSLFPVVQRVLNPPFINPHLPKMYCIYRELAPYLRAEELPALIRLEIKEYARRPKLRELPRPALKNSRVDFGEIESAIDGAHWEKTATLMAAFHRQSGGEELARRLLLLGSGYLQRSLGHSVSCTAFILLEMLERASEDPWPALAALADFFCKGRFHATPDYAKSPAPLSDEAIDLQVLRAASGKGIVNLHHTITFYALERVRRLFSNEEYHHMINSWVGFMGDKDADRNGPRIPKGEQISDYPGFHDLFSKLDAGPVVAFVAGMTASQQGQQHLGRFLIKGLCDLYQGDYNPHYLSGLGSALFILDRYRHKPPIVINTLYQYLDFFFDGIS